VTGVRDYVDKNRFPGVLLGLSGGIDSALVLAICVDALGADRVHAVMMPSQYTAGMSVDDSRRDGQDPGRSSTTEIAIKPIFEAFKAQLAPSFAGKARDATEGESPGTHSRHAPHGAFEQFGSIVVTTGNKSEMATGYATSYGDMAGGYALLKDIVKTLVYRWRAGATARAWSFRNA
jgi:NAD+ synthetase